MKLFTYKGMKVVTVENIEQYITEVHSVETIKNYFGKWLGADNYIKLPHPDAMQYGQKKYFNYARGINLYPVDKITVAIAEHLSVLVNRFDTEAFLKDLSNGVVRALPEDTANKNWRENNTTASKPVVTIKKQVSVKQPQVQVTEVVQQETLPVDEVYAMIDRMSEIYLKSNNELRDRVNELITKVEDLTTELENKKVEPEPEKEAVPSVLIVKDDASFKEWMGVVDRAIGLILDVKPEWTKSSILSEAYERLRAQYGIVWEQEAKEFKAEYGRGPVNTRELCWWLETTKKNYKNLLIGKLNTIFSECKREVSKQAVSAS